ncbi:MAG: sporulation protein YjcZ [Clostridiales bacterium]|nr:sporulation protein YjcZ [Clostridiales bacterium]
MEEIKGSGFGGPGGFLSGLFGGGNFLTIIIIFFLLMLLFGDGFSLFGDSK